MKMVDFEWLPLADIANALAATPHSRRMAGAILTLCPDVKNAGPIARACRSPEFGAAAAACENEDVVSELIATRRLPLDRLAKYVELGWATAIPAPAFADNAFLAIGDPRIPHPVGMPTPGGRLQGAVLGNPAVHGVGLAIPISMSENHQFLRNAATFGNFENKSVVEVLKTALRKEGGATPEVLEALCARDDIEPWLMLELVNAVKPDPSVWRDIMKHPLHQKLVSKGAADGTVLVGNERLLASPAFPRDAIVNIFNEQDPPNSLVLAPQCPKVIYDDFCKTRADYLSTYEFLSESPWAKHHFAQTGKALAAIEFLRREGATGGALMAAAVDALPFDDLTPDMLKGIFLGPDLQLACAVGVVRSKKFTASIGAIGSNPEADFALLFSPNTSGVQLDRFATRYPDMAALAALHPNGADIPDEKIPREYREVVRSARGDFVLKAKSSLTGLPAGAALEL